MAENLHSLADMPRVGGAKFMAIRMKDARQILLLKRNLDEVFNERDGHRRLVAIQSLYSEDALFCEGEDRFEGWLAISQRFDVILAPTPPHLVFRSVRQAGRIDDLEQLSWELGPSVGPPVAGGLDVAIIQDGRIKILYTFIDPGASGSDKPKI